MKLNANSTDADFAAFDAAAIKGGRNDLLKLSYGVRMLRDANGFKDPIAVADRLILAMDAFTQASVEADKLERMYKVSEPLTNALEITKDFFPQFQEISLQCFERFNADRKQKIAKFKSGPQQLKSARATIKQLERLHGRYTHASVGGKFDELWGYWQDQAAILEQYDGQ